MSEAVSMINNALATLAVCGCLGGFYHLFTKENKAHKLLDNRNERKNFYVWLEKQSYPKKMKYEALPTSVAKEYLKNLPYPTATSL
jgi:hypothetical protein